MKKIVKLIVVILAIFLSIALLFIGNGYNMYKEAIEKTSLEDKVEEIKEKKNYTKISELCL